MTDRLGEALARMDQVASVFVDPTKGHIQQVAAAARNWHTLHSRIYDDEGHVHEPVRLAVESAIKRYPNMEAEQWVGGVAAIRAVLDALTDTAESE